MRSRPGTLALALALAPPALTSCGGGVAHVGAYVPKQRPVPVPETNPDAEEGGPGSLWTDSRPTSTLFSDSRALRVNDIVTVKVTEIANAQRSAETDLSRQSSIAAAYSALLSAAATATPKGAQLQGNHATAFNGTGATSRTEQLTATVPCVVRKVLANGNLYIEGHRVVLVNSEEQHFYLSGVVRPIDIQEDDSVLSSVVAEAEVEFTGRGVLTDNQERGWLAKVLSSIWPF